MGKKILAMLFGGAITAELPRGVIDVSQFRQVPDNQEVFIIEPDSKVEHDKKIIIEIMELPDADIVKSLQLHVSDLLEQEINEDIRSTDINSHKLVLHKFNDTLLILGVIRLEKVLTDILISLFLHKDLVPGFESLSNNDINTSASTDIKIVENVLNTFKVLDWDLFG